MICEKENEFDKNLIKMTLRNLKDRWQKNEGCMLQAVLLCTISESLSIMFYTNQEMEYSP